MGLMSNRKRVALNELKKETKKVAKIPIKKIPQKKEKSVSDGKPIMLEGDNALLLAEACKLNKTKKAAEKRLKAIKKEMGLDVAADYENKAGDTLALTFSDKFTDVEPEKLFNLFVKNRKKAKFWGVVKVQLGELVKIVPESSIAKMREKLDPTAKWTFK